jgi:hypothetical protein
MLRLKLLACKALYRECSLLSSRSSNFIDATYLQQGLHDTPSLLHDALQAEIDRIDAGTDIHSYKPRLDKEFDAIILAYGLCSNAIVGLRSEKYKIVVPRCDDCIALFLGSYKKYREYFDANNGTYWYNASWIENGYTPSKENDDALLKEYTEKYGEDNAKYIMEMERTTKNYSRCAYVQWDELNFPEYIAYTKDAAKHYGWEFDLVGGNSTFLGDLFEGNWDSERFLVVPPGKKIVPEYSGKLIEAEGAESEQR